MRLCRPILLLLATAVSLCAQWGGELRFCLHSEPRSLHPALADDDASETVRYLTGGVLLRVNRTDQKLEPALAVSWRLEDGGRTVLFQLREGLSFSDGTPFTAEDVAYTMRTLMDPALHSGTADSFRSGAGPVTAAARSKFQAAITFPQPVAGVMRLFDQVAILSHASPLKERAVLGPFRIAEHKPGSHLLLERNPHYWKSENGRRLPYLDRVRLDILQNRELELLRFKQGQVHFISGLDPDLFEQLAAEDRSRVRDAGPMLEGEMLWFNQNAGAPIPEYRKTWFRSRNFRRAVSHAIRRSDIVRIGYRGHASPGVGPFSPANLFWFNQALKPHAFDLAEARRLLALDGFTLDGHRLRDRAGQPVEFSLVTNSGNRIRERIAALLQQDLAAVGIRLNLVPLDFPSLLERITKSFQYEASLLGLINVDLDPNGQMNVWLSSGATHPWHPNQKSPATPWEAEIDGLMRKQATTVDERRRKALFDRVQQIVWDEAPVLYLINRNALVALSRALRNVEPSVLRPQVIWNVDRIWLAPAASTTK
jgi:peptide/nickel transport system substrate-binding protein